MNQSFEIINLSHTLAWGKHLGELIFPGAVLVLVGPLGAGKTHLVRGLAEGLGILNSQVVSSPTFVLIQEYSARLPIFHFDAYRLRSESEFADLGVDEYFRSQGVCVIEWGDKVRSCLPLEFLEIIIQPTGAESRRFHCQTQGALYDDLLKAMI